MTNIIDKIQVSGVTYDIGGSITIDPTLDTGSTNPVANSAITTALDNKANSSDTITSVGLDWYDAIQQIYLKYIKGGSNWSTPFIANGSGTTLTKSGGIVHVNVDTTTIQPKLSAGTNITIVDNVISAEGGGKAIEAGRGITVTTGETADTVSFNLPISAGTGSNSIIEGNGATASGNYSHAEGSSTTASGNRSHAEGDGTTASGYSSHAEGGYTVANGNHSHAEGYGTSATSQSSHAEGHYTKASGLYSHAEGNSTTANNSSEHASGQYNVSNTGSTEADNTLFSVGNGTSTSARHNAFEIRQNGDIYLSSGGTDIKLQDHLGGGGSSYTAGDGIDITNNVISVTGKADTSAVTAIQDSLSGYVTTDTDQDISGIKTFVGEKKIKFKQSSYSDKLGFTLYNSASTNNELAAFELRPNTITVDGVQHSLLYTGHYRSSNTSSSSMPQTFVGYRQFDQFNAAAYHYLIPLPEKARTPFSLTTTFKNYYAPIGFKNGSTMITADETGVVDLSSELGGLKLVKLSQSAYDALSPNYDSNTLYVIVN